MYSFVTGIQICKIKQAPVYIFLLQIESLSAFVKVLSMVAPLLFCTVQLPFSFEKLHIVTSQ